MTRKKREGRNKILTVKEYKLKCDGLVLSSRREFGQTSLTFPPTYIKRK
jgi:hypothetical protein